MWCKSIHNKYANKHKQVYPKVQSVSGDWVRTMMIGLCFNIFSPQYMFGIDILYDTLCDNNDVGIKFM